MDLEVKGALATSVPAGHENAIVVFKGSLLGIWTPNIINYVCRYPTSYRSGQ